MNKQKLQSSQLQSNEEDEEDDEKEEEKEPIQQYRPENPTVALAKQIAMSQVIGMGLGAAAGGIGRLGSSVFNRFSGKPPVPKPHIPRPVHRPPTIRR
jgi:hypothetical protein